jgi:hypothetical protein
MSDIFFFYKAVPKFGGKLRVLEFYRYVTPERRLHPNEKDVVEVVLEGQVDDGIRKEHAKEYAAAQEILREHGDALLEVARANPEILIPIVPVAAKVEGERNEEAN